MTENIQTNKSILSPLLASVAISGGNQDREEFLSVWEQFDQLSQEKQEVLGGQEIVEKIRLLQEQFSLTDSELEGISVLIRWYYFGQQTIQEFSEAVVDILEEYPEDTKKAVDNFIQRNIFTLQPAKEESTIRQPVAAESSKVKANLQILQALAEYPNLGNQIISSERIRIKSQPEPVRGSLLNWIKYYRDELGIGQHSTVERGQFLFGSVNGKVLSSIERERVNIILKSLEENLPLEIDTERQEVIFPVIDTEAGIQQLPVLPSQGEIQVMSQPLKTELPIPPAFVPQPLPSKQADQNAIARKFQPSPSPYQKISIPPQPLSPERMGTSNAGIDVSQVAEKLKREPKPEWIKGAFTKESIPEAAPVAKAVGNMSFSFNHALPAEQEVKSPKSTAPQIPDQAPKPVVPVSPKPVAVSSGPIKEPVSPIASPRPRASQFHIRPVSQRD